MVFYKKLYLMLMVFHQKLPLITIVIFKKLPAMLKVIFKMIQITQAQYVTKQIDKHMNTKSVERRMQDWFFKTPPPLISSAFLYHIFISGTILAELCGFACLSSIWRSCTHKKTEFALSFTVGKFSVSKIEMIVNYFFFAAAASSSFQNFLSNYWNKVYKY